MSKVNINDLAGFNIKMNFFQYYYEPACQQRTFMENNNDCPLHPVLFRLYRTNHSSGEEK